MQRLPPLYAGFFIGVIEVGNFKYNIKSHPTLYSGVQYRSRLEARWAAFFDLIGWQHEYEPIDLQGWSPDFRVVFLSTLNAHIGMHQYDLFVEVKPYYRVSQFAGHASCAYMTCESSGAMQLGANPEIARAWLNSGNKWDGMVCLIGHWPSNYSHLWSEAGNRVQWKPPANDTPPLGKFSKIVWEATRGRRSTND